ncbi:expressed unknown protein [Seminavis robusta]|uniref:Uncharacterized protein n=1 Tax=Seminavis robusta TaxID=568900 RepID=A0A9N8DIC8_9STRA|nr:expressed unknown protein [Seminavis robusta]|eukprot:Sro143_g066460.1 n/a (568) ;mRNA; f:9695-11398
MGFGSSGSVISFGTNRSNLSKLSKRSASTMHTMDALIISQATAQAAQAAKAIIDTGGSELTALKTAKAAAVAALMPESGDNDMASGIGTSFLRRRRLKRRAEVVASMALASAITSDCPSGSWDASTSLQGLKLINGQSTDKLGIKESASLSDDLGKLKHKIGNQLKMIPSLSTTFSGSGGSGRSGGSGATGATGSTGVSKTSSGESGEAAEINLSSSSAEHSMSRQMSNFTNSTQGQDTYSTNPNNELFPRRKHGKHGKKKKHGKRSNRGHDKCGLFPTESGCLTNTYEDDVTMGSDLLSAVGPMDSMLISIINTLSCGGPMSGERPREIRVPTNSITSIEEEEEYDEEEIIFSREQQRGREVEHAKKHRMLDDELFMTITQSHTSASASVGTTGEEILQDLMATTPTEKRSKKPPSNKWHGMTDGSTYELTVPAASDSVGSLTMDGLLDDNNETPRSEVRNQNTGYGNQNTGYGNQNTGYGNQSPGGYGREKLSTPSPSYGRRHHKLYNTRFAQGYNKLGGLTPPHHGLPLGSDAPGMSPAHGSIANSPLMKAGMGLFRRKRRDGR